MKIFEAREILGFAIQIEEQGRMFYDHAATIAKGDPLEKIFLFLSGEEEKHKKYFEDLKTKMDQHKLFEDYPEDYQSYMNAYLENIIFPSENRQDAIKNIDNIKSAINFAIRIELDSILYYHEIKRVVPSNQLDIIDRIIEEERTHFVKLVELKKGNHG
ncbi:ferritin family protein [Candidatus Sumerlaeota bacterium]|nr:ferritin family protein [Candidatus Sumerlaeota bacterium]